MTNQLSSLRTSRFTKVYHARSNCRNDYLWKKGNRIRRGERGETRPEIAIKKRFESERNQVALSLLIYELEVSNETQTLCQKRRQKTRRLHRTVGLNFWRM
jgi:hypothetical protein